MTQPRPRRRTAAPSRSATPAGPTPRRTAIVERTREEILLASARALARSGFRSVSMQEIAREVGFTAPALYAYFDSKEAIFAALVAMMDRELADTFRPGPARGLPFRERVRELVARQLEWADRRREVFAAFFALHMRGEQVAAEGQECGGGPAEHLQRLGRWLRRAADRPRDLGGHDPDEAAALLMGIGQGMFLRWMLGKTPTLAEQTDLIVDFFFHGVGGPGRSVRRPRRATSASTPPAPTRRTTRSRP